MPKRIEFNLASVTDCDCDDDRNFDVGPMERKHFTAFGSGDLWCCGVLPHQKFPRPLFPLSGQALVDFQARNAAKTAAKAQKEGYDAVAASFQAKRAELKAKVAGGDNLTTNDMRDLLELWVQL